MATSNAVTDIQNPSVYYAPGSVTKNSSGGTAPTAPGSFSSVLASQYSQGPQYSQKYGTVAPPAIQTPQQYVQSSLLYTPPSTEQAPAATSYTPPAKTILTLKENPHLDWRINAKDNIKNHELKGGRVIVEADGQRIDGIVKRVFKYNGTLYAEIDNGEKHNYKYVPLDAITEIVPRPELRAADAIKDPFGKGYIQFNPERTMQLGYWWFIKSTWSWKYFEFENPIPVIPTAPGSSQAFSATMYPAAGDDEDGEIDDGVTDGNIPGGDASGRGANRKGNGKHTEGAGAEGINTESTHRKGGPKGSAPEDGTAEGAAAEGAAGAGVTGAESEPTEKAGNRGEHAGEVREKTGKGSEDKGAEKARDKSSGDKAEGVKSKPDKEKPEESKPAESAPAEDKGSETAPEESEGN